MHTRFTRTAVLLLCLALSLCTLSGCQPVSTPAGTLQRFEEAYNRLDMNGLLDCFEPVQAEAMRSVLNIAVGLTGIGISGSDVLGIMPLFSTLQLYDQQGQSLGSPMPKIAIQTGEMQINGNRASCPFAMVLSLAGEQHTYSGTCTFVREKGSWYIATMQ